MENGRSNSRANPLPALTHSLFPILHSRSKRQLWLLQFYSPLAGDDLLELGTTD